MRSYITWVGLICSLTLTACGPKRPPQESCNFVQNSEVQRVSWKSATPVLMYIHESVPEEYRAAILKAMSKWEYSLNRSLFHFAGIKTGEMRPAKDGENVIYWMGTWTTGREAEQARTTIYWVGNQIEEADMFVNAKNFSYYDGEPRVMDLNDPTAPKVDEPKPLEVDFESLILHELGHVLGLQHNNEFKSVMAEHLASGLLRRQPQEADVKSLQCEY